MKVIPVSLIVTVYNEQSSIISFLKSALNQTQLSQEIIIVDGGSKDKTVELIESFNQSIKTEYPKIKIFKKSGNRAVGRNFAVKNSKYKIILCSDAGNVLDKKWVENIVKPFKNRSTDVVAGYYKGIHKSDFEESLIPYALVMEDKIDKSNFLPATRSMAFTKNIWKKAGGFDESLSHNEDYAFANRLKKINAKIVFAKDAIVNWKPRKNLKQAFIMFFRFAYGDSESGILRDKVVLIFLRYFLLLYLSFLAYVYKSLVLALLISFGVITYIVWSVAKNSRYVKNKRKYFFLPALQVTSDLAVMSGSMLGAIKKVIKLNYRRYIVRNWKMLLIFSIYVFTMLSVITWGIPNVNHPFLYHMDEWHQLQSVRFVFKYGTPNLVGAANGTMFHFFLSGVLLIPFIITHIVNPLAIKSAIDNISVQHTLFIILRLNTLFFGLLTLVFLDKIAKILKLNSLIVVLLFALTPVWLMLSNNFKYDIALTFWLVCSFYRFIVYSKNPSLRNFIIAGVISALSLSVKVSAAPILPIFILSFFFFTSKPFKNLKKLFLGLVAFILTLSLFGIPDIVFGGRNMNDYLYSNIVTQPNISLNINLGYSYASYVFLHHFPTIFGHVFFIFFTFCFIYMARIIFLNLFKKNKENLMQPFFIFTSLIIFYISLLPLKLYIVGNRALPLLPLIVLITGVSIQRLYAKGSVKFRKILVVLLCFIILAQIVESYLWVNLKLTPAPQQASSEWILQNVPRGSTIGIESIPLYQEEPDIILKEFYNSQYKTSLKLKYKYEIIDPSTPKLPDIVVISNTLLAENIEIKSPKKDLIKRLEREKYKRVISFTPSSNFFYFFGNSFNFMYSGLIAYPEDISVFKK